MAGRRLFPGLVLIVFTVGAPLGVVGQEERPKRPKLDSDADTNSAQAYYDYGLDRVENSPGDARDAFYWATRLEPTWGQAWYAHWIASLLSERRLLSRYLEGRKRTAGSDLVRLDSLHFRALLLDPFLHRSMDQLLIKSYLKNQLDRELLRAGVNPLQVDPGEMDYYLNGYLAQHFSKAWVAWQAYTRGDFAQAIQLYNESLEDEDDQISTRLRLASIYYLVGTYDKARESLESVLATVRELDEDELVIVYESKAMTEYYLGRVLAQADDPSGAREAYARALVEDFSFYPAHVQLGQQALDAGDTLTGMSEFQLAVDIGADDPIPIYSLAYLQRETGQPEKAAELFGRVIELEPFFALPYLLRGITLEQLQDGEGALDHYEKFLALAPIDDRRRGFAEQRAEVVRLALGRSQ